MTFEAIYDAAVNVVNQIAAGGEPLSPDKTVCVICSGTGRIYYGVSRVDMVNGAPVDIHAEIDAMRNMQDMGENKVETLILIDSFNRTAMLPCNNCVGFILSQNPENSMGTIAMPDRLIPLSEVGMFAGGGMAPPMGGFTAPPAAAAPGKNIHAKGDLLKDRVNSIMQGVDDDDDEEEQEEKPKKKKFFGLFG